MPRKNLVRSDSLPYHVTARANNREAFFLDLPRLWELLGTQCLFLNTVYKVEFHAVVLMPNHIHMILTVPEFDLGLVMNDFMRSISRRSNLKTGRTGHVFGGPYFWSLVQSSRYFSHVLKYVYRNPVRANLCEKVEDYPYSTLRGLVGAAHLPVPIHYTRSELELFLPAFEGQQQLLWLNTPFSTEVEEQIKKGLRRKLFEPKKGTDYL